MIVALSEPVQVAVVSGLLMGSIPAGITAALSWRGNRRTASKLDDKIGEPNGHGNVVEMLTSVLATNGQILAGQAGQDRRLARLEGGQHVLGQRVDRIDRRVGVLEAADRPPGG